MFCFLNRFDCDSLKVFLAGAMGDRARARPETSCGESRTAQSRMLTRSATESELLRPTTRWRRSHLSKMLFAANPFVSGPVHHMARQENSRRRACRDQAGGYHGLPRGRPRLGVVGSCCTPGAHGGLGGRERGLGGVWDFGTHGGVLVHSPKTAKSTVSTVLRHG